MKRLYLDPDGKPFSVRYHLLAPMLLNEVQKQQKTIGTQADRIEVQEAQLATLVARLDALESQRADQSTGTDR